MGNRWLPTGPRRSLEHLWSQRLPLRDLVPHRQPETVSSPSGWPGLWVVDAAERLAFHLLGQSGDRWSHTRAVAARATEATLVLPAEQRPALIAAAWLHDIGYAASVRDTGFHPLDGARHLKRCGWPPVIAGLVAHHSGARFVATVRRLDDELADFADPMFSRGSIADALTWADQTTSPTGQVVDLDSRLADMLARHGPDSPN